MIIRWNRPSAPFTTSGTECSRNQSRRWQRSPTTHASVKRLSAGQPKNTGAAGDLDAVLRALRNGVTYANIHTAAHSGGEIRGQIQAGGRGDDEHEGD